MTGLLEAEPVVRVPAAPPERVAARLRAGDPPVVARVEGGALWLDLRTVPEGSDGLLGDLVLAACRSAATA